MTSYAELPGPCRPCRPLCAPPGRAERGQHRTQAQPHLHRHPCVTCALRGRGPDIRGRSAGRPPGGTRGSRQAARPHCHAGLRHERDLPEANGLGGPSPRCILASLQQSNRIGQTQTGKGPGQDLDRGPPAPAGVAARGRRAGYGALHPQGRRADRARARRPDELIPVQRAFFEVCRRLGFRRLGCDRRGPVPAKPAGPPAPVHRDRLPAARPAPAQPHHLAALPGHRVRVAGDRAVGVDIVGEGGSPRSAGGAGRRSDAGDEDQGVTVPGVMCGREPRWEPRGRTTFPVLRATWTAGRSAGGHGRI